MYQVESLTDADANSRTDSQEDAIGRAVLVAVRTGRTVMVWRTVTNGRIPVWQVEKRKGGKVELYDCADWNREE